MWIGFIVVITERRENSMRRAHSAQNHGTGPDLLSCLYPKTMGVWRGDKVAGNDHHVGIQTIHMVNNGGNVLLANEFAKVDVTDLNQSESIEFSWNSWQSQVDRSARQLIGLIRGKA